MSEQLAGWETLDTLETEIHEDSGYNTRGPRRFRVALATVAPLRQS